MEVHKELGNGFLEAVYQEVLEREFIHQCISFHSQPVVKIYYKGQALNKAYQPDFICFDEVLVQIKALSNLTGMEESKIINYMKATALQMGLLLNSGSKSLGHERFVYNLRM